MSDPAISEAASNTDRFYTQVKSLNGFDALEVRCVIDNLLSKTEEENCYVASYIRVRSNVESLLLMKTSKDVQAIAIIARAIFELAVDVRLLEIIPGGWMKMMVHADVEKLRLANRIVAFAKANPDVQMNSAFYQTYIDQNSVRIVALRKSVWPEDKNPRHWSGMDLGARCTELKTPFNQIYAEDYARVSWYAHPGLPGINNVPAVAFVHMCASAYYMAVRSYREVLLSTIRRFKLSHGNEYIIARLDAAMKFPFTDTLEQIEVLRKQAGL